MAAAGRGLTAAGMLLLAAALGEPALAIDCEDEFQRIRGRLVSTPWCQDNYLATVAREYGMRVSVERIRNNPNYKKDICRFIFNDIRVRSICGTAGVPEYGGPVR